MSSYFNLLIIIACAAVGGLVMMKTKLPGGVIIGAMLAVIAFKYLRNTEVVLPGGWEFALQVLIGASVGSMFETEMVQVFKAIFIPVLISAFLLICMGLVVAFFVIKLNLLDPGTAYIASSPGAMAALVGMAAGLKVNAPVVLVFHLSRIIIIILSAPLVIRALRWLTSSE